MSAQIIWGSSLRFSRSRPAAGVVWLLSWTVLAALGCSGCSSSTPPADQQAQTAVAPPPPPPPPAAEVSMAAFNPVTLDPSGSVAVEVKVERNGKMGPIHVEMSGAPDGVSAKPLEIPDGQAAGKLEVTASEKLGDAEVKAKARVVAKVADGQAEQPLELTVKKVNRPAFLPVGDVLLVPGETAAINLKLERNGFQGPLKLRLEGLPAQITGQVAEISAEQSAATLNLTAAAKAPEGKHPIRVSATAYGRPVVAEIPVQIDARPYQLKSFMVVNVQPGETKRVEVPIERRSYKGPLVVELSNLPDGVTCKPVKVGADAKTAALEIVAAEGAKERVRSTKVASVGGELSRVDPMVVRVSRGHGFLPEEISADPQLGPLLRRGSFGGRLTAKSKQALVDAFGGTPESEEAVMRGLRWLAAHQREDGGWSLKDYGKEANGCDCGSDFEKEVLDNDVAATAFGLLPFLGAGVAHNRAPEEPAELADYQDVVKRGLKFLGTKMVISKEAIKDGTLDSNMYAHALATIVVCEAYGLSAYGERADDRLRVPAQKAIKHIAQSQHNDGGWRYGPRQPGDMSATGWMFLAIRSGQLSGLPLERQYLNKAQRFITDCAAGPEEARFSRYAYQPQGEAKLSLSAAGLLTRQYLGWKKDVPDLGVGVKYLMENMPPESGTSLGPIYYYYYATQVLHHMEGAEFDLWNHRMREHLIRTQAKDGHKAGSWNPQGVDYGSRAGRLYSTSMALMTLEVYYRHLPLYRAVVRGSAEESDDTSL